jgi:biofilm protein TabA
MVMQHEKLTPALAAKWLNKKEWAGGLQFNAHKSTDALEFSFQYAKNKLCWDMAFAFLRGNDLQKIAPGKYAINGDMVYASVAEAGTKKKEETRWEAHKKYIDIQYVALGSEKIGVAPLSKAVNIEDFNIEKDLGFYEIPEAYCKYYTATPDTFFIFFPQDVHRPCIKLADTDFDKKIVIKIKMI